MAEGSSFERLLRGSVEANLRYYETLTRATAEYAREVARIWGEVEVPGGLSSAGRDWQAGADATREAPTGRRDRASAAARGAPALVLEAASGEVAAAEFAVSNDLGREVEAEVVTSGLRGPRGDEVDAELRVDPAELALTPGERTAVTVEAVISEALTEGVTYRGEVTVPGLSRQAMPLIVRRRGEEDDGSGAGSGEDDGG